MLCFWIWWHHNRERIEANERRMSGAPRPNGIACPKCGSELLDSFPLETLLSNPPQKNVHCSSCGYQGYRYC